MDREQRIQTIIEDIGRLQRTVSPSVWQESGLSRAQAGMLYMLHYHQGANMKQISEHLSVSKSAASQLLEPLIDKGLVSREPNAQDRRSAVVRTTPKGLKVLKAIKQRKMLGIRSALDLLTADELEVLAGLHTKMAAAVINKGVK
jgi:DNA-binding MarR family transcriptional regulator